MYDHLLKECRRALEALIAWEQTAALTHNRRHAATAAACRGIAVEHMRAALQANLDAGERAALTRIERNAQRATVVQDSRAAIAASLAQLEATAPQCPDCTVASLAASTLSAARTASETGTAAPAELSPSKEVANDSAPLKSGCSSG